MGSEMCIRDRGYPDNLMRAVWHSRPISPRLSAGGCGYFFGATVMSRFLFPLALAAFLISPAFADDAPKKEKPGEAPKESAEKTPSQKLKEDPNDTKAIIALVNAGLQKAMSLAESKPDDAAKLLTDLKAELEAITPDKTEAKQLMVEAKAVVGNQLDQIEIQKIPLVDLENGWMPKGAPTTLLPLRSTARRSSWK